MLPLIASLSPAQMTNVVESNPTIASYSNLDPTKITGMINDTNLSKNVSLPQTYDVEQYGATPLTILGNVSCSSGSSTIICSGAAFNANNIGNTVVLYQDATNDSYILTKVVSVASATSLTLQDNATTTGSFNARYGKDCTTNIQNAIVDAWNGGGGTVLFHGMYMVAGALTNALTGSASVLYIPTSSSGTAQKTIVLKGEVPPIQACRGLSYSPNLNVSGIFCPTLNPTKNRTNAIISMGSNLPLECLTINGLQIMEGRNPQLTGLYAFWGGNISLYQTAFIPDYESGFTAYGKTNVWASADPNDTNTICAVVWPTQNNPGNSIAYQTTVLGWPVGMAFSEHSSFSDCTFFFNGVGLEAVSSLSTGSFGDFHIDHCNMVNRIELSCPTNYHGGTTYFIGVDINDLQIDGTSPNVWNDPNNCLHGFFSYFGNPIPMANPGLTLWKIDDAAGPAISSMKSAIGDMNFWPQSGNVNIKATNGNAGIFGWGRASDGYLGLENGYVQWNNSQQTVINRTLMTNGWVWQNSAYKTSLSLNTNGDLTALGKITGNGSGLTNLSFGSVLLNGTPMTSLLTIGAFANAPTSTSDTTNYIAGWMLVYTNAATGEQRWLPYITNHP